MYMVYTKPLDDTNSYLVEDTPFDREVEAIAYAEGLVESGYAALIINGFDLSIAYSEGV